MSDKGHDRPNAYHWLRAIAQHTQIELRGDHNNPLRAGTARIVVLWVVLPAAGGILWQALLNVPKSVVAIIALALAVRVVRWFFRRP